jgi:hypothetical protein
MVRQYSAIIRTKTPKEIYLIITNQTDPRIALILAAATDKQGLRLFPDLLTVKQVMFGPSDPSGQSFVNPVNNIFVDGLKRVTAALCASILIGQLAQIHEQAQHSHILEEQALADLNRLLQVPDIKDIRTTASEQSSHAFYFEPKTLDLTQDPIRTEFYMASGTTTGWYQVGTYSGQTSTGQIVADIADAINTQTLVVGVSNVIAAASLGDPSGLYSINFNARQRELTISCEVITIRFITTSGNPLPFQWGLERSVLRTEPLNSALLTVQQGKASTNAITTNSTKNDDAPTVLYFRRVSVNDAGQPLQFDGTVIPDGEWKTNTNLTFRVSPMMSESDTVTIPYETSTDPLEQTRLNLLRPSVVAETLLNALFSVKGDTLSLGALVRNDNPTNPNSLVAIELIAFSVTNPQCWMILDVLEIPPDVQMAVGNLTGPLTPFSNKPRSIRVESKFHTAYGVKHLGQIDAGAGPKAVKIPVSSRLQAIREDRFYNAVSNQPFV